MKPLANERMLERFFHGSMAFGDFIATANGFFVYQEVRERE